MKQVARPATAAEVLEMVGALDDAVLIEILEIQRPRPRYSRPSPGRAPTIR